MSYIPSIRKEGNAMQDVTLTCERGRPSFLPSMRLKRQVWASVLSWGACILAVIAVFAVLFVGVRFGLSLLVEYLYRANYSPR
jgi:hypothetical protein